MTTGEKIKMLRTEKNMTQAELGEKIGVKFAAINKYETGIVVNLKRSTIQKLADALDTTPAFLMGWEESANTQQEANLPDFTLKRFAKNNKDSINLLSQLNDENIKKANSYMEWLLSQQETPDEFGFEGEDKLVIAPDPFTKKLAE